MPVMTKLVSTEVARNPMVDMSNKLYNVVDNLLSSFVARCGSLPLPSMKMWDNTTSVEALHSQDLKEVKGVSRTTVEELMSLKRP